MRNGTAVVTGMATQDGRATWDTLNLQLQLEPPIYSLTYWSPLDVDLED